MKTPTEGHGVCVRMRVYVRMGACACVCTGECVCHSFFFPLSPFPPFRYCLLFSWLLGGTDRILLSLLTWRVRQL